jgi:hypothetical protein
LVEDLTGLSEGSKIQAIVSYIFMVFLQLRSHFDVEFVKVLDCLRQVLLVVTVLCLVILLQWLQYLLNELKSWECEFEVLH